MATSTVLRAPRLVFTGLSGSLLDHHSYDWQPAAPWLQRLAQAGVPVIPVSSKTRAELMALRLELGLEQTPFIAENGAVIGLPPSWQHARLDRNPGDVGGLSIKTLGVDIDFLRWRLGVLRARMKVHFRSMGEMTLDEVVAATELSESGASQTRIREGSEPLIWDDSDQALDAFRNVLRNDGLKLTRGGRFWHVTGNVDKGRAVRWLISRFVALRGASPQTLGLGDGPNDVPLFDAVDRAVLIRSAHRQPVDVSHPALYDANGAGPQGWAEGLDHWLGSEFVDLPPRGEAAL